MSAGSIRVLCVFSCLPCRSVLLRLGDGKAGMLGELAQPKRNRSSLHVFVLLVDLCR